MNHRTLNIAVPALTALTTLLLSPAPARACAVCFGDPNSSMIQGAKAGAIFLGLVVYALLMGIGGIIVSWTLRAKKLAAAQEAAKTAPPPVTETASNLS